MGLVVLLLWRWRDRFRPGVLFGVYLVPAGAERLSWSSSAATTTSSPG